MIFRVAIFLVGGWVCKKKGGFNTTTAYVFIKNNNW